MAQRAGIPAEVLERAREVLAELEAHHLNTPDCPGAKLRRPRIVQSSLFANSEDPILEALRQFDVAAAKPEDVVAQVAKWQRDLRK